jgi:hypothetical protein
MKPLRILITNTRLAKRTGTEMYVYELALELLERGHRPVVYSPAIGLLAERLRSLTVPVVQHLDQVGFEPDIIHGHHGHPTLCACLRFPRTPAVYVCHAWESWQDAPPRLPRVRRYLAVDIACRDRLVCESGIPEQRVRVLPNFVNLRRFQPRGPLPSQPQRALLFTYRAGGGFVRVLRRACGDRGIELDLLGSIAGGTCEKPEDKLGAYDIVFARGKAALEALAVGAAVILCDRKGLGPLVTLERLSWLRRRNFGRRTLTRPVTYENVSVELARYSAENASQVCARIRETSPLTLAVDQLLATYRAVIRQHADRPTDPSDDLQATSRHLEDLRGVLESGRSRERILAQITALRRRAWDRVSQVCWPFRRAG